MHCSDAATLLLDRQILFTFYWYASALYFYAYHTLHDVICCKVQLTKYHSKVIETFGVITVDFFTAGNCFLYLKMLFIYFVTIVFVNYPLYLFTETSMYLTS